MKRKMEVWEVSEKYWDSIDKADAGNIIITEKHDGWYMMGTGLDSLDSTIKETMEALKDDGKEQFNGQLAAWLEDLQKDGGETWFNWTDSGLDGCLMGRWERSWEIEYNDSGEWQIFLAVAK